MRTIQAFNRKYLGAPAGEPFYVKEGPDKKVAHGHNGAIWYVDDRVEAIGMTVSGYRNGPNEDSISVHRGKDDSLLFQVADGMGGHGGGVRASTSLVRHMGSYVIAKKNSFDDDPAYILRQMEKDDVPEFGGATYAGLLIGRPKTAVTSAITGDSSIVAWEGASVVYVAPSHGATHLEAQGIATAKELKEKLIIRGANKIRIGKMAQRLSEDQFLAAGRVMFPYVCRQESFIDSNAVRYTFQVGTDLYRVDTEPAPWRAGMIYALYSDGIGDNLTPYDLAEIYSRYARRGYSLENLAYRLMWQAMRRQCRGGMINISEGERMYIRAKLDNASLWLIKVKTGDS